ncbi:unnamed protein product [Boreogadus saida]
MDISNKSKYPGRRRVTAGSHGVDLDEEAKVRAKTRATRGEPEQRVKKKEQQQLALPENQSPLPGHCSFSYVFGREADFKEMQTRRRKGKPPDPSTSPFFPFVYESLWVPRRGRAEAGPPRIGAPPIPLAGLQRTSQGLG